RLPAGEVECKKTPAECPSNRQLTLMSKNDQAESLTTQLHDDIRVDGLTNSERRPVLTSLRGELLATPIPLERDVVTLGRALDADIRLNDSKASRLHAQISAED